MHLGASGIFSGFWLKSVTNKLQTLTEKNEVLEAKLLNWDKTVTASLKKLSKAKGLLEDEIQEYSFIITNDAKLKLDNIASDKLSELSEVGTKELLSKLQNGSVSLKLSGLSIANNSGINVIAMYPDKGGDGYIRVNAENGDRRYLLNLSNNRPQSSFYNDKGKLGLSLGIYGDSDRSFMRFRDINDGKTLFSIDSNNKGGKLSAFANDGRQIVYLGPESNTGSGLVNVHGINGEETASHAPK